MLHLLYEGWHTIVTKPVCGSWVTADLHADIIMPCKDAVQVYLSLSRTLRTVSHSLPGIWPGPRLQQPLTALAALQPGQQAQLQAQMQQIELAAGQRPPEQVLSLRSLVCRLLPTVQAVCPTPAGRSVSTRPGCRRLPDSHLSPLWAAMVDLLPGKFPALPSAAAQHLQSCQPHSRISAVLRKQARLPMKLSCRLPSTSCLSLQELCLSRL